jgi:hypothetical protein
MLTSSQVKDAVAVDGRELIGIDRNAPVTKEESPSTNASYWRDHLLLKVHLENLHATVWESTTKDEQQLAG